MILDSSGSNEVPVSLCKKKSKLMKERPGGEGQLLVAPGCSVQDYNVSRW